MKAREPKHYVLCVKNDGYDASLEVRKVYEAIADPSAARQGFARVIDESAEDYLYPRDFFVTITLPKDAKSAFLSSRKTIASSSPGK